MFACFYIELWFCSLPYLPHVCCKSPFFFQINVFVIQMYLFMSKHQCHGKSWLDFNMTQTKKAVARRQYELIQPYTSRNISHPVWSHPVGSRALSVCSFSPQYPIITQYPRIHISPGVFTGTIFPSRSTIFICWKKEEVRVRLPSPAISQTSLYVRIKGKWNKKLKRLSVRSS